MPASRPKTTDESRRRRRADAERSIVRILDAAVDAMAERLASGATKAIRWSKVTTNLPLRQLFHSYFDAGVAYECLSNLTADHAEAVAAFRERRKPVFTGR